QPARFTDADDQSLQGEHLLVPLAAVRAGVWHMTEQGSAEHAFSV
ncbi:amidohydrolase/deacetylase family metallohydrolase, partial [Cronobacter dublinensis]|nr:amidohydrolase/deacetylase family metallohydrolase [Cronobacter dublinensis]